MIQVSISENLPKCAISAGLKAGYFRVSRQTAYLIWDRDRVTSLGSVVGTQLRLWPCDTCADDKKLWIDVIAHAINMCGLQAIINPPHIRCTWCCRQVNYAYNDASN